MKKILIWTLLVVGSAQALFISDTQLADFEKAVKSEAMNLFLGPRIEVEFNKAAGNLFSINTKMNGRNISIDGNFNGKSFVLLISGPDAQKMYTVVLENDSQKVIVKFSGDINILQKNFFAFMKSDESHDLATFAQKIIGAQVKVENKKSLLRKAFHFLTSKKVLIPTTIFGGIYLLS